MTIIVRDLAARPYTADDQATVLDLVDADRLPGQPLCTPAMLAEALAGRSGADADRWSELSPPRTDVLVDAVGRVLGVVSYAVRPRDDTGMILWLHGREIPAVVGASVRRALLSLGRRKGTHAFTLAPALTLGLAALPQQHRPATRRMLERLGFSGWGPRRYLRRIRDGVPLAAAYPLAEVLPSQAPAGWRLQIRGHDGDLAAEATVGTPVDGVGVVWWIGVQSDHRGNGLGRTLLHQALSTLYEHGAREAILYADDVPAGARRDRAAADRLYQATGFTEVDRLVSYTRHP